MSHAPVSGKYLALLSLTALGVVFGDIGTSPLYAIRECFNGEHALSLNSLNVYGVLSLIFWSITLVISLKYMIVVLRADNNGEGGILSLMALVHSKKGEGATIFQKLIVFCGLFGSALLYGDGAITPAISVLSAIEGLQVATPIFTPYILPITVAILIFLFSFQKYGTGKIGTFFGPIMVVWFVSMGAMGLFHIVKNPQILTALNPYFALNFFLINHWHGLIILGAVFLAVTGGEAIYADMGHFGKKPIQMAWFFIAMPCLLLNYFGQGALILFDPSTVENPFFHLAPNFLLYPLVILAAMSTVIASQAVISGVFSLTNQAMMLGYFPRVKIYHTSSKEIGQIYIPLLNWLMLFATLFLVFFFKTSSSLAAAYGIAVSTTMVITTLLVFVLARKKWNITGFITYPLLVIFLLIDLSFLSANSLKIMQGGWFPLVLGLMIYILLATWSKGREILKLRLRQHLIPLKNFLLALDHSAYEKTKGYAIFLSSDPNCTPPAFIHNLRHNHVIHEKMIFLNLEVTNEPYVMNKYSIEVENLPGKAYLVKAFCGFKQSPNILHILELLQPHIDFTLDLKNISFFLSHETLVATDLPGMAIWREKLFAIMSRNQLMATEYFSIPRDRVVELGLQIEL